MSSMTHDLADEVSREHMSLGLGEFTRLERMLLFAVIAECERCIGSEGVDCFDTGKPVSCPFVGVRHEYGIRDICEWKGVVG